MALCPCQTDCTGLMVPLTWLHGGSRRTDGDLRAKLRAHLAALQPVELVVPSGQLSATTWKVRAAPCRHLRGPTCSPAIPRLCCLCTQRRQRSKGAGSAVTPFLSKTVSNRIPAVCGPCRQPDALVTAGA